MSVTRAKRFLESKFGADRYNGNGIARLLEEYRNWEDNDEVDSLLSYCKLRGFRNKSNKRYDVDNRTWAYVFLYVYHNKSVNYISDKFYKTHGAVSLKLRDFAYLLTDKSFMDNTKNIREAFKMDTVFCLEFIESNRIKKRVENKAPAYSNRVRVFGGTVPQYLKKKYDKFKEVHNCRDSEKALIELLKRVEI